MPRKKADAAEVKTEVGTEAVKKPVEKKAAKPEAEPKQTVKIQFGGAEFDLADIRKAVEADIKSKFKGKVKTVEVYIKPEDKAAYYVVNSDFSDKVEL